MTTATAAAAAVLVLVHLFSDRLRFLHGLPRSSWLSLAGGMSVAYVFVHLLPELNEAQEAIEQEAGGLLSFTEDHVYLVALLGLALFYGLESAHRRGAEARIEPRKPHSARVFWVAITSFGFYNILVGYLLLHRYRQGLRELLLFALAMALHLLVTDYGLKEDHHDRFIHMGRWILASALLVGVGVGAVAQLSDAVVGVLIGFLGGGVILNVMKEELPEEQESRFWAFAAGTVIYTGILLAL